MQWPQDAAVVPPEYLARGMSFDEMLESYKRHVRSKASYQVDDEGDEKMDSTRSLKINKKGKGGGIKKDKPSVYTSKRPPANGASVVVRNVPFTATEDELKKHFNHLGKIIQVRIHKDEQKKSIGSGIVTFSNRKDAIVVVDAMQNTRLGGRPISVTLVE